MGKTSDQEVETYVGQEAKTYEYQGSQGSERDDDASVAAKKQQLINAFEQFIDALVGTYQAGGSDELSAAQGVDTTELRKSGESGMAPEPAREEVTTTTPPPTNQPGEVTSASEAVQVVGLAVKDVTKRLNLSSEEIRLSSVEAVDWRDASLGCPQPGMMYPQVITPGFRVVLEAQGETYVYHTDAGDHIVLCQPEEGS